MSPESFDHIFSLVEPLIIKNPTTLRKPVSPAERLSLTLTFLASGSSQTSMSFTYRIGRTTVSNIIRETCWALWQALHKKYLKAPRSHDVWKNISDKFMKLWNFPHCIGAIDGEHIAIECPSDTGSLYYNYKGFFSVVLMDVCDPHYVFSLMNVGDFGSNNDSRVLENSAMGKAFACNQMGLPDQQHVECCKILLPYFLVGDDIFALKSWLLGSFPRRSNLSEDQQIYNYRLSRA